MIFISYARTDLALADQLANALERVEQEYWIDRKRIMVSDIWSEEIEIGIKQSHLLVVILTEASCSETSFVRRELRYARLLQKPIIALVPEQIPNEIIPFEIADLQHIECHNNFAGCLTQLLKTLTPIARGACEIKDRRNLLDASEYAIISHFRNARSISIKQEITKGKSGSRVFFVDALFHNSDKPPIPHFLKLHRSQSAKPKERHEMAARTSIGVHMPTLADATMWDENTKLIAVLYSLMTTTRFNSLDQLLDKNLAQAATLINQVSEALFAWYKDDATQETLSLPELLMRALHDSIDPESKKRRLENPETNVQSRIEKLLGIYPDAPLLDFGTRRGLPNPLAYLVHKEMWDSEQDGAILDSDISYPSGPIHGDLNVRNILALYNARGQISLCLIDFDTFDPKNLIFIDFAYLEIAIIMRLCSPESPEHRTELERLSDYLASGQGRGIELVDEIPDLNVISVGTVTVLRLLRKTVSDICDDHPEYDLAYWIARVAAGLEMARKTRTSHQERVLALLIAADSLNRLINEARLKPPMGNAARVSWIPVD